VTTDKSNKPLVAIACGGSGGHLFPGLAVAEQLTSRQCEVLLLISDKEIDQRGLVMTKGVHVSALPAVGLNRRNALAFLKGFTASYFAAKRLFQLRKPQAALAMGGFTSAPPLLAAKHFAAHTFLHESNTIPGRANRWLSPIVEQAFVGFPESAQRLYCRQITVTGTPVRRSFKPADAARCRSILGLVPSCQTVLIMGGSQGAAGVNSLVLQAAPIVARLVPDVQWLHLSGAAEFEKVSSAYRAANLKAVVHPFFDDMPLALGAATMCISRAGASSLAELAAMRVPSIVLPYPNATDNHQFFNAKAFQQTGATHVLDQKNTSAELLAQRILELLENPSLRVEMQAALDRWHAPGAAERITEIIVQSISASFLQASVTSHSDGLQGQPLPVA
jgi:UDP-N-acetylglucosamine--N-acetylmuramyl-(pentapeptide) pyrophosphoryl-undecaprenol N-acetylglucosamine transferase